MEMVQWTDDLSVGVDLIDEQHKMLVKRLNDLHAAVAAHQGQNAISSTLGFLIEYAHFHFETEEKYMAESNYPGMEHHQGEHGEYKKTLASLEQDFKEDGATHELAERIDTLLVNWFIDHILAVDMQFSHFLQENNIVLTGNE